jgi:hypothetical protein
MNRMSIRRILLLTYAFITGAIFGWGIAFLIITPLFQLFMTMITGSDRGAVWTNYFIYMTFAASIIAGIFISEKWCLSYLARKENKKQGYWE